MRAFDAGWGGVVTKTIGLHPVVNVAGPKTKFLRATPDSPHLSMQKRPGTALHSSWNWELISDKPLDWWVPRHRAHQAGASRSRSWSRRSWPAPAATRSCAHWQTLATACQDAGADALELNLSCPHMDRKDMGSNIGKDQAQISIVTKVVKEVARVPVWAKLTPSTTDIVVEARGAFLGGADAITSSNTFPSLPLIDPETLEFEVNVDGYVSSGGLGGPAILPLSLAKMAQLTQAFPDKAFSGIGGVAEFAHALELLPARLRHGAGLHRGDARSRDRPDGAQDPAVGHAGGDGAARLVVARGFPRRDARPRRRALEDSPAGRRGVSRRLRREGYAAAETRAGAAGRPA